MKIMKSPRLLLSRNRIDEFSTILAAYAGAGIDLGNFVDGGAGAGKTALKMLPYLGEESRIFAFEPFPGNHRFFVKEDFLKATDRKFTLIKKALSSRASRQTLKVSSVMSEKDYWGSKLDRLGYSSAGRLSDGRPTGQHDVVVDCVRLDDELAGTDVGFVKLDLQGGELNALQGMGSMLENVHLLWIEFMGQRDLYEFLHDHHFTVFDSSYVFHDNSSSDVESFFHSYKLAGINSTNRSVWRGWRRESWANYLDEFSKFKRSYGMIQTDLLCINRHLFDDFQKARKFLTANYQTLPLWKRPLAFLNK